MKHPTRLILAIAAAAAICPALQPALAAPTCGPWDPGSAPYGGGREAAAQAVERLPELTADERRQLTDMVRQGYGGERVMVARDGITSGLAELRHMNGRGGDICPGAVDRSTWPAGRNEAAVAYRLGRHAVLVLESCGNVALATNAHALPPPAPPTRESLRRGYTRADGAAGIGVLAFAVPNAQAADPGTARSVPEPGTWALTVLALLAAWWASRRSRPTRDTRGAES